MARLRPISPEMPAGPPSRVLLRWARKFSLEYPVLDAGCGTGRNAITLTTLGLTVICADKDEGRLRLLSLIASQGNISNRIMPILANLRPEHWPFGKQFFSAVICVHFLDVSLWPLIHSSLRAGGYLYVETPGAQGENYRELPRAGVLRTLLEPDFHLEFYQERPAGPPREEKRVVKLLARKIL